MSTTDNLNDNTEYVEFKTIENFDFMSSDYKSVNMSKTRIISMFKGDSGSFDLFINVGTILEPDIYELQDDDILKLYVLYPNSDLDSSIIYKEYTKENLNDNKSVTIKFDSDDTQYLNEGVYYYTIKLYRATGDVVTIQKRTKFILMD